VVNGAAAGNLPAELTRFFGREQELEDAVRLLRQTRLLTLTGVGGVGKTRLALQIAARLRAADHVRAWMIDLGTVHDPVTCTPQRLYAHMALAMGVHQHAQAGPRVVLDHLGAGRELLVLDNCEPVVPATRVCVTELLGAAPHLRILATSRQVLKADGEHTLLVPPLPPRDARSLFIERATAAGADVAAPVHADLVADLCRRLDGLPLAIRLAAGRTRLLSLRQLLAGLDDRFKLLAETGDSTLEHVVDWSYQLCTGAEQKVWARASVFASTFDLAAVEAVCGGDGIDTSNMVDIVAGLVDKSVLTVDSTTGTARYQLLETLRDYGLAKLLTAAEVPHLRSRHRDYYHRLVARQADTWLGPGELDAMAAVHQERPDILSAVDSAVTQGQLPVARAILRNLVRVRAPFFYGFLPAVLERLLRAIETASRYPARTVAEAKDVAATAATAAWVAVTQGRDDTAQRLLGVAHQALDGFGVTIGPVLFAEGASQALGAGRPEGIDLLAAARAALSGGAETSGDEHMATMTWAMATAFLGTPAAAVAASAEHLRNAEARRAPWAISWALWVAALAALRGDDHQGATDYLRRALRLQRDMRDQWGQTWSLYLCACVIAARLGDAPDARAEAELAAWLLGAARDRQRMVGVSLPGLPPLADLQTHAHAQIAAVLDESSIAAAMRGGSRGQAHAVRVALGEPTPRRATASGNGGLTDREREIAALVAQGLTSGQIGAQLRIGPRTVDVHVGSIMQKLGVRRRIEIAARLAVLSERRS